MKLVIRFSKREEAKAMPILFRHSPGMILRDRTYIVSQEAAALLRNAGVHFTEVCREAKAAGIEEAILSDERI